MVSPAFLPPVDGSVLLPDCVNFNMFHNSQLPVYVFARDDGTSITEVTYLEYGRAAHRVAQLFAQRFEGSARRTVAILAMADALVYQTVVMGCLLADLVPFPMSPRLPAHSIAHLLRASNCTQLLVAKATLGDLIRNVDSAYASLTSDETHLSFEDLPSLNDIYPMLGGETPQDSFVPYSRYKSPSLSDIAIFLHSSGSTGIPKAIPISHEVMVKRLSYPDTTELRTHKPAIRFAGMALPPFHQLGLAVQLFNLMYTVKSVALYPPIVSSTNAWPMVPTTENVLAHAMVTGVNAIATVPSFLEVWAQSADAVEFLSQMEFVAFAGGALPSSVGEKLVRAGVKLSSMYGSTEVGGPTHLIPQSSSTDWEWLRFGESIDIKWVDRGDDMFELQFLTSQKHAFAIENLPDVRGYSTSDLWRKHPTNPRLWQFAGRLDDVIALSTGEKVIPMPMENLLTECKYIRSALLFGEQRHQLGLLVEPQGEFAHSSDFIETIWPVVDTTNNSVPAFARVFKDMIIVAIREKLFARSPKGTIVRKMTISMYSEEIESLYSAPQEVIGGGLVPKSLELGELMKWLALNVSEFVSANDIHADKDLFRHGIDSVTAILLRNRILRTVPRLSGRPVSLELNVVAHHPTIRLLATHIRDAVTNSTTSSVSNFTAQVKAMITTYLPYLPVEPETKVNSEVPVVVLAGSTGSFGSHILSGLIKDPRVGKIYALNRPSGTPALERHLTSFRLHGLDLVIPDDKVVFLDSAYHTHRLGLSEETYEEIRRNCTLIIQNGWRVDFNLNLNSFSENIMATRELVNLGASTTYKSKFLFISSVTAAVCEAGANGNQSGYGGSKFVAEQLIERSGLDSISLRFGQLCGGRATGAWSTKEWFPLVVKSALTMGCLPKSLGAIHWLPTDVAASIVLCAAQTQANPHVLAIENPSPLDGASLMEYTRSSLARHLGSRIDTFKMVPLSEWITQLESGTVGTTEQDITKMPALKILQFLRDVSSPMSDITSERYPRLGRKFHAIASAAGSINEEDVDSWIVYWKRVEFL